MIYDSICSLVINSFTGYLSTSILAVVTPVVTESGSMGWRLIFALFLVFLNGFFVAAEFAIVKVRASQIEIKAKTGSRVGKMAKNILICLV